MNISGTPYGSITPNIGSQAARDSREAGDNLPVSTNDRGIENGITQRNQQYNLENMSGNEFRSMANELYEQGSINADTHENMIRSLLFSTGFDVSALGGGAHMQGAQIDDQNRKMNMIEHFETVLLERKEDISNYNLNFDLKPYEDIVTTLEQLDEKYSSPSVNLKA